MSFCYFPRCSPNTIRIYNLENCDRSKDSVFHNKTKTKTQFKREFLKSKDVAKKKKDNSASPSAARGQRLSLLLRTFMNYFQLFFITGKISWKPGASLYTLRCLQFSEVPLKILKKFSVTLCVKILTKKLQKKFE